MTRLSCSSRRAATSSIRRRRRRSSASCARAAAGWACTRRRTPSTSGRSTGRCSPAAGSARIRRSSGDDEVEDRSHPSTQHLGTRWTRSDEWYAFRSSPRGMAHAPTRMDESSYEVADSKMGASTDRLVPRRWPRPVLVHGAWPTCGFRRRARLLRPPARRAPSVTGRVPADCTPNERDAPVLTAPPTIVRRELCCCGLPVRLTCLRGCRVSPRLTGLVRRTVRLRPRGTVRRVCACGARGACPGGSGSSPPSGRTARETLIRIVAVV